MYSYKKTYQFVLALMGIFSMIQIFPIRGFAADNPSAQTEDLVLPNSIEEIGGEFQYLIPHFKAFPSQQKAWGWESVTQTIFFALTGYEINQSRLADLGFGEALALDYGRAELLKENGRVHFKAYDRTVRCEEPEQLAKYRDACSTGGDVYSALAYLGVALAGQNYPAGMPAILKKIRDSLIKNIPVGIYLDFYNPKYSRAVVVYGAKYSKSNFGKVSVEFNIFDPRDGGATRTFYPLQRQLQEGVWNGAAQFANFESFDIGDLSNRSCYFLIPEDESDCLSNPVRYEKLMKNLRGDKK